MKPFYFCDEIAQESHSIRDNAFLLFVLLTFKVEQKRAGLEGHLDRQKQGAAGNDIDSVRASILDEAVIVCNFSLKLESFIVFFSLNTFVDAGFLYSQLQWFNNFL